MEDAAGMTICQVDTVAFNSTPGDRGRVVQAVPNTPRSSNMMLQVQRVDGTRVEAKSGDLTIVDRSCLRPGMVVASASDPGSQLGVVMAAATALDLVRFDREDGGQEAVARGVSATELRRVTELCLGDYVVSAGGRWLGRVVETYVDVDVLFDDGGRCRVTEADRKLRTVETGYLNGYANTPFYQGRRVVGRRSSVFKASRWLSGSYWKPSYVEGTVAMVKMAGVLVCWLASPDTGVSAPPAYQQNLDDLIFFSSANIIGTWSVGDRCFFRRNPDDHESSSRGRGPPTRKRRQMRRGRSNRTRQMRLEFERPMSVADTHTTVDVLWQDGTRQRRMPSVALLPFVAKNEHDFFPGQHVRRAADDDGPQGVVRSLDCVEQTVRVSWLNNSNDETLSAYHLRRILDHDVFYGNVVVRLDGDAAGDLSWVGRVVHLCDDGQVQVKWGDGNTTEVLPREIVVVKEQPLVEIFRQMGDWWVYDDGSDAAQDETNEADPAANTVWTWTQQNTSPSGSDSGSDTDDGPAATRIIARVIQPVIRLGSRVIEQGKRFRVSGWTTAGLAGSENIEPVSSGVGKADDATAGRIEAFRFLQFDVVQSPPDHHYLDTYQVGSGQLQGTNGGRKWTKRVQREWKILENDLPDTIYVRAFEDRMDLLRAVMVGVSGTPYQDGLFFFDLQLSSSYPAEPPLVNYRSFGLRVNPNLYESGTVCLSLLNTFGGEDTELWSPESSTVLQVLVSIQGLVLTAQPYYNESGYESQVGTPVGRRNELPYSENTYLLSLQTMLHLLRRPPAGFEDFVKDHFRRRGQRVLRACEAYREGCCLVGTLDGEGNVTEASTARPCSAGFRLALANVVPRLKVAFAEIGAQGCEQFSFSQPRYSSPGIVC